jgi:hypothetical protein
MEGWCGGKITLNVDTGFKGFTERGALNCRSHGLHTVTVLHKYKVVQVWPGRFVCKQVTVCPGHIWTTFYHRFGGAWCFRLQDVEPKVGGSVFLFNVSTQNQYTRCHVSGHCNVRVTSFLFLQRSDIFTLVHWRIIKSCRIRRRVDW